MPVQVIGKAIIVMVISKGGIKQTLGIMQFNFAMPLRYPLDSILNQPD